ERHVVVILLACKQLDALHVLGGDVVAQLDDDAAVFGVDQERVLRIGAGGQLLRKGGRRTDQRGKKCKQADHGNSRAQRPDLPANFAFRRTATGGGTNGDTSPPIDAICRTSVAVIGRTVGAAGRKTPCTAGAIAAFIPPISISESKALPPARPPVQNVPPPRRAAAATAATDVVAATTPPAPAAAAGGRGGEGLVDHGGALAGGEQGCFAGMRADRKHEPVGEPCGLPHDIEMTIGDGIKGSRKKRGARHGGGLARALGSRKPSSSHLATGARVAQPGILVLCHAIATTIESEL